MKKLSILSLLFSFICVNVTPIVAQDMYKKMSKKPASIIIASDLDDVLIKKEWGNLWKGIGRIAARNKLAIAKIMVKPGF